MVVAVPSRAFRKVTESLRDFSGPVISVTKGIEHSTGLTMCGILEQTAPKAKPAALSGPSLALEVARGGIPTRRWSLPPVPMRRHLCLAQEAVSIARPSAFIPARIWSAWNLVVH